MKRLIALCAPIFLAVSPLLAAPKAPAKPAKPRADPLNIPAFAAIPNEFVFAGTQKDLLAVFQNATGTKPGETAPADNENLKIVREVEQMLRAIHVLRVRSLSFRGQGDQGYEKALDSEAAKKEPSKIVEESTNSGDILYSREQRRLAEAEKFYAALFAGEGGKARLELKNGATSLAVYAFSSPRTFAVLTRGPSRVIVARADGLPNLAAISGVFQGVVSR